MNNPKHPCFDELQFNRFLESRTEPNEEARILAHIATCHHCQTSLEELAGHQQVWRDIKDHLAEHELPGEETREHLENQDRQRDLKKIQQLLGPTDNPEMLGRLGGYEVCGMIGRGSAGVVVKALDTRLNRFVAIKLLAPVYSNNGSSRRRFEREGRAIASVKDPNVIPVHTVGDFQGTPYIVMQYVPDGSLHQRIESQGPLDTNEVVCVGMQVAKGLAAAHKRGIVHRDVKPANVLLESGVDCAMVTDFGLARVVDEATMTRSGAISGTPQYMSPEQAKGESVDPRSDLFSLGSVMYTACTGHSPFRAESVFGVIKRVCDSQPRPIRETSPEVAEWLVAFIAKLHAKRPEDRFQSANQVAELLSQELAHLQAPTMVSEPERKWWTRPKPQKRASRFGWRTHLAATILVIATTLGIYAMLNNGDSNFNPKKLGGFTGSGIPQTENDITSLLEITKQENEKLPSFTNSIQATIDVQTGGTLFLRSNLGTLNIETHNKPTVELKLTHTVSATDQEIADKMFRAVKMDYGYDSEVAQEANLTKGRDAVILATFPTRKLTQKEIDESVDLEELKDQLLIRNNSHFRNAEFSLLIPNEFNLDLETSAGPIEVSDIKGNAKLLTHGGHIQLGNVIGELTVLTHGGHIEAGNVSGQADVETHGGRIELGHVNSPVNAVSHGGSVTIWQAESNVQAESSAGSVNVNFVGQPDGDSVLKSGAGSVKVGYVEGLDFEIDASCGTGKISAPFAESKSNQLNHKLNNGNHKLTVFTGTGSIKFRVVDKAELDRQFEDMVHRRMGSRTFQRGYDLHMEGRIDEALELHKRAAEFEQYKGIATYNIGCAWALKGDKDKAFAAFNDAITFGFTDKDQFVNDEDLDSLRTDDRYAELMKRLDESSSEEDCCDSDETESDMATT